MLGAGGCRSQPHVNAHIESVNAEYRQLEDYVYALEEENARLHHELKMQRDGQAAGNAPARSSPPASRGPFRNRPADAAPAPNAPPRDAGPGYEPPLIEVPTSSSAPANSPPTIEIPRIESPPRIDPLPSPTGLGERKTSDIVPLEAADKRVTHLFLNPALTGGVDFDGQAGDDGLRIVLEPRNAGEQFVAEPGLLSVVVLDPARQGEAARIARWDFDESATRQLLADAAPRPGIKLELPWPASAPAANRLQLFIRFLTADGRRLQTDRELFLQPPGQAVSRWTPRSSERPREQETAVATHQAAVEPASQVHAEANATAKHMWPDWSHQRDP